MPRPLPRRQRLRRALLLISFIAFPVTMNYFSPYLIVESSFLGIVNGSLMVFATMLVGSVVFGRLWCGWACPAAGLQEPLAAVNSRRVGRRADAVKWAIWVPWVALIGWAAFRAGGYHTVDVLYGTVGGVSVAGDAERPVVFAYVIYFAVVLLFFGLAAALGRRGGCHAACWMAPFMIAGGSAARRLGTPTLQLATEPDACVRCGTCTTECPMGLDVQSMVATGSIRHSECVLCGTCVDGCQGRAIRYSFSSARR